MKPRTQPAVNFVACLLLSLSLQANGAILLSDDFNDGNANGWLAVKDTGSAPDWRVTTSRYQQTNGVHGFVQSFHTGTFTYYANGFGFTDY
jgi:hypothetical protein